VDLRTLSSQLGLSITTVSRALGGYPDVSARTRERVIAAAEEAGYRPNRTAQRLKTGRADAVGLVLPTGSGAYGDAFFAELIAAIGAALSEHGLDLVITAPRTCESEAEAVCRLTEGGRVDGLIVPRTLWDDPRVDALIDRRVPFVTHGRTRRSAEHAWHDVDGSAAMRLATERLLAFGHRRIAYLGAPEFYSFARYRQEGFEAAMTAAGLAVDRLRVRAIPASSEAGERAAAGMLATDLPPTAFLCATDRIAYGAMAAIRAAGLTVGRDVSVIGHDDLVTSSHQTPPLTTLRLPIREQGAALVSALLAVISGADPSTRQDLASGTLIARASDGPAPPG
jgi:LacI family transcriptional regulator